MLCDRRQPQWSIKCPHHVMLHHIADDRIVGQALALEALSGEWKTRIKVMRGRFQRGEPLSSNLVGM